MAAAGFLYLHPGAEKRLSLFAVTAFGITVSAGKLEPVRRGALIIDISPW